jgi:hypothetical protein
MMAPPAEEDATAVAETAAAAPSDARRTVVEDIDDNDESRYTSSSPFHHHHQVLLTPGSLAASMSAPRVPPKDTAHRRLMMMVGGDHQRRKKKKGGGNDDPLRLPWIFLQPPASTAGSFSATSHEDDFESKDKTKKHPHHPHLHETTTRSLVNSKAGVPLLVDQRLRERLERAVAVAEVRGKLPHPHLVDTADTWTRIVLGSFLPVSWQHHLRDSGAFRDLCDLGAASLMAPAMALSSPSSARTFWKLSSHQCRTRIRYGSHHHARQVVDVYLPTTTPSSSETNRNMTSQLQQDRRRMVVFVHGGAWGR